MVQAIHPHGSDTNPASSVGANFAAYRIFLSHRSTGRPFRLPVGKKQRTATSPPSFIDYTG
jgi:hypothetical protein